MLDNLQGISEERKTAPEKISKLEFILELEKRFLRSYGKTAHLDISMQRDSVREETARSTYEYGITPQDLQDYINYSQTRQIPFNQEKARGIMTGSILEGISESNSLVHIDGNGQTFNFLFYLASVAGTVIIENLKGNHIGGFIGMDGKVDDIILVNCCGEYALHWAGTRGKLGNVVIADCKGLNTEISLTEREGYAQNVICIRSRGKELFDIGSVPAYHSIFFADCVNEIRANATRLVRVEPNGIIVHTDQSGFGINGPEGDCYRYNLSRMHLLGDPKAAKRRYQELRIPELRTLADKTEGMDGYGIAKIGQEMSEIMKGWK